MNPVPQDWMRLDNAAKIYPASMRKNWKALFRLSATLTEPVDPDLLEAALLSTLRRVPTFSYRLRKGMFWYYLERGDDTPRVEPDVKNPCVPFPLRSNRGYGFRVRYYNNRIAVEIFHVLTDGTGGLTFLKTLVAEYLRLRYGADIPRGNGILDCTEPPRREELEDSFVRYARPITRSRAEADAYHLHGVREPEEVVHITTGILPVNAVSERARAFGVTITEYLTAVMLLSIDELQRRTVPFSRLWKPVKISVPVNLRTLFPSETLRNFASYVTPGIDPALGEYTLGETVKIVHHFMRQAITEKELNAKFSTNVQSERSVALRMVPLFLKNVVMRSVYMAVGDKKSSTTLSNLGRVELPPEMGKYVTRLDFIVGPLVYNQIVSACIGYGGNLYLSFTRTIKSPALERAFFTRLVKLGVPVQVESNGGF